MYSGRVSFFPRPATAACNIVLAYVRKEISLPIYYRHKPQRFRRPQTGCVIIGLTNSVAAAVRLADLFFLFFFFLLLFIYRPSCVVITHTIHGYALIIIELSPWSKTTRQCFSNTVVTLWPLGINEMRPKSAWFSLLPVGRPPLSSGGNVMCGVEKFRNIYKKLLMYVYLVSGCLNYLSHTWAFVNVYVI